jgi:hypothetical protein
MMAMMNIEHQMELPTPRSMARTSYRVHVWCKACCHAAARIPEFYSTEHATLVGFSSGCFVANLR